MLRRNGVVMAQITGDATWDWLWHNAPWWMQVVLILALMPLCVMAVILLPALWLAEKWGNK